MPCRMCADLGEMVHLLTDRRPPALELGAQGHRDRVLQVGAAHLEDPVELTSLCEEGRLQLAQGLHVALQAQDEAEMEGGRIDVVRRLAEVHVVVGVDVLVLALLVPQTLEGEVGDHLVGVHVGRGAGATLDEVRDEMVVHVARDHPVAGADDRVGDLAIEHAEVPIRHGGGLLHVAEGLDEVRLPGHGHAGDVEILLAPEGLHAVVGVVGNLLLAQEVLLDAVSHWSLLVARRRARACRYLSPATTIFLLRKAIWVWSGRSFGHRS